MILRPDYIEAVKPFMDAPLVKILTGVRRCGKSTIFEMIRQELLEKGIPEDHIIMKKYTEMDIPDTITAKQMYDELVSRVEDDKRYYFLLDEIQEIKGWEKAVNSLLEGMNADIYVTGSNSKLMSSEISTYLTGRYISIPVFTLSFREYLEFKKESTQSYDKLLEEYIKFGGFPIIALGEYEQQSAYQIVDGIYHTVVSRDIVKRHRINKQNLFDRVVKYVIENMGKTFSASSISNFLKSENRKVSIESIYNYLRWLEQAFIIFPCERYDMQGKSVLKTQEKYYLADVSFRYALFGYNRKMLDGVMENIVYLELRRRGYDVYVGKNNTKEIDFIAIHKDEKIYVQVCVQIPENSNRELGNLMEIRDHYPKYVVTLNEMDVGIENGIRIVHLRDFLLAKQW
ncbi:MAG: ATP-binding protein [Firmicutes bacterium]|nr:ATP-binding protein [Bacillota bacterium]MDY4817612.1 ATP-binding protein [Lachnospiraceae bacterium]